MSKIRTRNLSKGNLLGNTIAHVVLIALSLIWIIPIVWIILISFSKNGMGIPNSFFPQNGYTFQNYVKIFTETGMQSGFYFPRWFLNTFYMAIATCIISTFFVLSVSYAMSRMRFRMRRPFMNIALVLGFFPGFMALPAIYFLFKSINLTDSLLALILIYSGGSGLGFYIAKGFFDTIPKTLDEAAMIDGASRSEIFWKIIIPLSKPIIVYTIITSFLGPWFDYIVVTFIIGPTAYNKFNVARGLFSMIDREHLQQYFTMFAAGAVLVSIPITILFIITQKFFVEGVTGGSVKG
jgi:arabinogalactan oligomer / maltooligosaccharide transport system permease protein